MARLLFYLSPLVLALLYGYTCSAEQLTTASTSSLALSTSMPSLAVSATSPVISLTTSEPMETPLHMISQNMASDSIGFANVSGYYGPGTWSAWFLTLVASWIRLCRKEVMFDINTWLYIFGMNWAAGDMLIKTRELARLVADGTGNWMRDCASIGAAYTVVSWGLLHALCQTVMCFRIGDEAPHKSQRLITLLLGMLFPAISLSVFYFDFDLSSATYESVSIFDHVPAAYWDGMTSDTHGISALVITTFAISSDFLCIACFFYNAALLFKFIPDFIERLSESTIWGKTWQGIKYLCWTLLAMSGLFIQIIMMMTLIASLLSTWIIFVGGIGIIILSTVYIWMAYITRTIPLSQSCFFMPCAPQSITDSDQASALVVAILSLLAMEIGEPIYRNRRAKKQFQLDAERDFEMARLRRAGYDDNTAQGSEEAGEAGATGSSIHSPNRIDSGIAVEEGRAGTGLARRVRSDLQSQAIHEGLMNS